MAVSRIVERLQLDGVYGPLYTLFEVTDSVYNTAVELTAGTRWEDINLIINGC